MALHVLARIDPKSVERSTIIGISLFAASSIALQGFVVAQGSFSGRSSGGAQAAIVPGNPQVRRVPIETASLSGVVRRDSDLPQLRRSDRLTGLSRTLSSSDRELPRIASLVPADTVLPKPVTAADIGLRVDTLRPSAIGVRDTAGIALASRPTGAETSATPKPTRVAFAAGAASTMGKATLRDHESAVAVAPPVRAPSSKRTSNRRVPRHLVEKVHFQEHTPDRCLPGELMNVIYDVAEKFGEVQVLSTFRDPERNRRVGGAPHSFHLRCQAIDFRVKGRSPGLLKYLEARADVGGLKRYPLGFFHIDTGPRRTW